MGTMSLINQVLKDIEKRRGQTQYARQSDIAGMFAENSRHSYKWFTVLSIIFIAIAILGIASWWFWLKHKKEVYSYQLTPKQTVALVQWKKISTTPKPHYSVSVMTKVKLPQTQDQIASIHYQKAMQAIDEGKYDDALQILKDIIKTVPYYPLARQQLVILLIKQNRIVEAQQWLAEGLKQMPDYVPFVELNARILLMHHQVEQALEVLETVSPAITQYPEYYVILADVEQQLGNNKVSASLYERLLQYDSSNSYWWMGLGINLERMGQRNLAVTAYARALSTGSLSFNLTNYIQRRLNQLRGLSS